MKLGFYNQLYCFKSWECGQPATWLGPVDSGGQGKLLSKIRKDQRLKRTGLRRDVREPSRGHRQSSISTYGMILRV